MERTNKIKKQNDQNIPIYYEILIFFWAQILLRKTFNSDSYIMLEIKDLDTNIQETKWEPNQDDRIGQVSIPRTGKVWTRFEQVY